MVEQEIDVEVGFTDRQMSLAADESEPLPEFQKEALYARAASISLLIAAFIILLLVLFRKSLSAREAYGA